MKRKIKMQVYLTEEEYAQILESSCLACLSVSTFARNVCLGSRIISREDAQVRKDMFNAMADLGRLGGLLKLAITEENRARINFLLRDIINIKNMLKRQIEKI